LPLAQWPSDSVNVIPELLVAYDRSVALPRGEAMLLSAHYGRHNELCWIMVKEGGSHKASIEARSNDPPSRLIFTTSEGICVRLSIVK
jgi:hypothetical protein